MKHNVLVIMIMLTGAISLWGVSAFEPEETSLVLREIEEMSGPERTRLKANYEQFKKLSPQQQQSLRTLEQQISSSQQHTETMRAYFRWIDKSPNPYLGLELAEISSAASRVIRLNQLIEEQQLEMVNGPSIESVQYRVLLGWPEQVSRISSFMTRGLPTLPQVEFERLLSTIGSTLTLTEDEKSALRTMPVVPRTLATLRRSQEQAQLKNAVAGWPGEDLQKLLSEKFAFLRFNGNREIDGREKDEKRLGEFSSKYLVFQQRRLQFFVLRNLMCYETLRLLKTSQPSEEELSAYLRSQPGPDHDETSQEYRARMMLQYLETQAPGKIRTAFQEKELAGLLQGWKTNFEESVKMFDRGGRDRGETGRDENRPPENRSPDDRSGQGNGRPGFGVGPPRGPGGPGGFGGGPPRGPSSQTNKGGPPFDPLGLGLGGRGGRPGDPETVPMDGNPPPHPPGSPFEGLAPGEHPAEMNTKPAPEKPTPEKPTPE